MTYGKTDLFGLLPGEKRMDKKSIGPLQSVPVCFVKGKHGGPAVLISAGIHSREFVGTLACVQLYQLLDPSEVYGTVILLPSCNYSGFCADYPDLVPEDEKNLNRVFPGDPDGSFTDRLAAALEEEYLKKVQYHIDLHGGGAYEDLIPHVYRQGKAAEDVLLMSREMCHCVNTAYQGSAVLDTGGFYNRAGALNVPGILIERGRYSVWTEEEVREDLEDLLNILRFLKILRDAKTPKRFKQREIAELFDCIAEREGLWHPGKKPGDPVRKGETIGKITDFDGTVKETAVSGADGVLLYQRSLLHVNRGDLLAEIGKLLDSES